MAIYSDVMTRLDERSARQSADDLAKQFSEAGKTAGVEFRKGLQDNMHGVDLKNFTESFAGGITPELRRKGEESGKGFGEGLQSGLQQFVGNGLSEITGKFGAVGDVAESALGSIVVGAGAAALGVGGIAIAAAAVTAALFEVGNRWDEISSDIAARTDQVGDGLNNLVNITKEVGANSAASAGTVGQIVAQLSQSMPNLNENNAAIRAMSSALAALSAKGINVDIRELGMSFKGFSVDAEGALPSLNALYEASAKTGIPFDQLTHSMAEVGPAARTMGLNFGETAKLLMNFEQGGVDAGRATNALNHAAQVFATSNIDLKTGLSDTITQIRGFIDAGQDAKAIDLAGTVFGTKGAEQFVDLIRNGKLSVDELQKGLGKTGTSIGELDQKTRTWGENWDLLGHHIDNITEKIGGPLFDALNKVFTKFNDLLQDPKEAAQEKLDEALRQHQDAAARQHAADQAHHPHDPNDPAHRTPQDIAAAIAAAKGGGSGPQIPYPAEYGQGPQPGESQEHWRQRMQVIDLQHTVAEKQAAVDQLDKDRTASANDRVKAHNELIQAQLRESEGEQQLNTQKAQAVQIPYGPGYGAPPRAGETAEQYGAEQRLIEARHTTAVATAELTQVQQSATHTAEDLTKAQNTLAKARTDEIQTQMRLYESANKATDQLGQIGVELDRDFGISKGLPGIVENITKMLANFGAAPILGALKAGQIKEGFKPGEAGSGLTSVLANSGVFGPKFVATPDGTTNNQGGIPSTSAGAVPSGGGYPGDAALLSNVPAGRYDPSGDLSKGLGDCSSAVEDLVNIMDGRPTAGRSMSTDNEADWLTQHGFQPGMGGPGDFRVGFDSSHTQATLPGGTPFNWGSNEAAARGGVGGTGADDPAFTQHYYRPGSGAGGGASANPGGATPVFVVNMPGGGFGSGGGGTAAGPFGGPGSGATGGAPSKDLTEALQRAGIDPAMFPLLSGFSAAEGKNGAGVPTLGFTDGQAGTTLDSHAAALAKQIQDRQSVAGAFPRNGTPQQQAAWMATVVGQNGAASDWQGNAQPARSDYIDRIVNGMPGAPVGGGGYGPLTPAQLTDPGLTNPTAAGSPGQAKGGHGPSRPRLPSFPGDEGAGINSSQPGQIGPFPVPGSVAAASSAAGAGAAIRGGAFPAPGGGPGTDPTLIGGLAAKQGSGKGGIGFQSGILGAAMGAASSGAGMAVDAMAPGAGGAASAVMQIGVQEINRAIQFGSQAAGIAADGFMQTFLPMGASELAQNSWLTKIVGGIAGAGVMLPNVAGGSDKKNTPKGLTPEQAAQFQQGQGGPKPEDVAGATQGQGQNGAGANTVNSGNTNNTYHTTINSSADSIGGAAKDFAWNTQQTNVPAGR